MARCILKLRRDHSYRDHVDLALHADDSPSLLFSLLETYLSRLEHWLRDWKIAINVSATLIQKLRPFQFLREPVECFETARYLGVTLDTRLTWTAQVNLRRQAVEGLGVLGPLLNKRNGLFRSIHQEQSVDLQTAHLSHASSGGPPLAATSGSCKC
jgi:hypothetical protein